MTGSIQGMRPEEDGLKTYYGRASTAQRGTEVLVRTKRLEPLAHHVRHSPTGFEWGYSGQGPSELARCILLDAFGSGPCPTYPEQCQCADVVWVEGTYAAFRDVIIANFVKDEDWKLGQQTVVDLAFDYLDMQKEFDAEPVPVAP